jgi:mannitol 2-dehydrogenase
LCYFGHLAGYRLVHEAAADPLFARFLLAYMDDEATPTLEPVPGIDLPRYKHQLVERFSNGAVRDTIARLCADSSDRIPKWLLPVARHHLASGGPVDLAAAVVASWARYAEAVDEEGRPIEVVDRFADRLTAAARRYPTDELAFLRDRELFGDLAEQSRFTAAYLAALRSLHEHGSRATLEKLVSARRPG